MQQKVQFIITVLHQPRLLIFDEPFSGFDPINVNLLKQEILRLRENGSTIIFSTHNMASVEELCDNIALINRSRKILEGRVMDIRKQHRTETYEAELSNVIHDKIELPGSCEIISSEEVAGRQVIQVRGYLDHKPNELLSSLIAQADVHAFREILPTMNDIFIATVNASEE